MVKASFILLASLFAIGCSLPAGHPVASGNKEAVGHNDIIDWKCSEKHYDNKTISVKCRFHNFSPSSHKKKACVSISYSDKDDTSIGSLSMCSEPLWDDDYYTGTVSFEDIDIKKLIDDCGHHGEHCHLTVSEDNF